MSKVKINIADLMQEKGGILLDIGCGEAKQDGFVGMDMRDLPTVDIVHNVEEFPYPLPDECVLTAIASHLYEHIDPSKSLQFLDEVWRIMKHGRDFAIAMPYGWSFGYIQDPTHKNPANEATWTYFDPRYPLYMIYKPKPWLIKKGFPVWSNNGNMEVVLTKPTKQQLSEIETCIKEGRLYGQQ